MSSNRIVRRKKGILNSINGYRKRKDPPVLLPSGYYNTQGDRQCKSMIHAVIWEPAYVRKYMWKTNIMAYLSYI
jgi:hypothetical protein